MHDLNQTVIPFARLMVLRLLWERDEHLILSTWYFKSISSPKVLEGVFSYMVAGKMEG